MTKRILMAFLTALAFTSQAGAVSFFNVQFDVTAIAVTDGPAGFQSQSSPTLGLPVFASTSSMGAIDVATAGAIGGAGVMTSSADVSAAGGGVASAVATAHFAGSFINDGPLVLNIDFSPFGFAAGSGSATSSLFVLLTSGGVTLFQDFITGSRQFIYNVATGTTGVLDLTLTSDVSGGFVSQGIGDASAFGQVNFTSPVPEAATWMLFLTGIAALAAVKKGVSERGGSWTAGGR